MRLSSRPTLRLLGIAAAALLVATAHAAPPDKAVQTSRALDQALDQALRDYEAGDLPAAERRFRALSDQGLPVARFNLAMMHLRGETPSADPALVVPLLERAAAGGFIRAEHALGEIHELGLVGQPRDLAKANRWYARAAEHGHVDAQVALATAYYLGRGAGKDEKLAAHWYREAAKGGDVGAQYILASMYEHGDGVAVDLRLALYWYDIAARNGDEAAPLKRDAVDAQLRGS
jgi:uncharacterized protein